MPVLISLERKQGNHAVMNELYDFDVADRSEHSQDKKRRKRMSAEILIIRDNDCYRVLHGHLHLVSVLSMTDKAIVDVVDEGKLTVVKTRKGYLVGGDHQLLPVLRNMAPDQSWSDLALIR
jgi:hypothetical protein